MVGLILMKISLEKERVNPPNTRTSTPVRTAMGENFLSMAKPMASETEIATMNTAVAVKMPPTVLAAKKITRGPRSSASFKNGDMGRT